MLYGLEPHIIEQANSIFRKYPEIKKVIIYGSRAKGNYRNGSDIDLTILTNNMELTILQKIETEIDDLLLPYTFDISIFNNIDNQNLIEHIERVGLDFYKRDL
jgi:predicted nucleotidyltransferase